MLVSWKFFYDLVLTVMGVGLFAYIDKARGTVTVASCICGCAAFIVSELLSISLGNGFVMYFYSACVTCFLSEIGARMLRVPVTVILLPAIIPLVPGSLLYNSMRSLMIGGEEWYSLYGIEALYATLGIGVAIVAISAFFRVSSSFIGHSKLLLSRMFISK